MRHLRTVAMLGLVSQSTGLAACGTGAVDDADLFARRAILSAELRIDGYLEDLVAIASIAVAENGDIAIAQDQHQAVFFYTRDGELLGTFGRRGGGPGEFTQVGRLGWLDDSLWVFDPRQRRITIISPSRTYAGDVPVLRGLQSQLLNDQEIPAFPFLTPLAFHDDGTLTAVLQLMEGQPAPEAFQRHSAIARVTHDGAVRAILNLVPAPVSQVSIATSGDGQQAMGLPLVHRPIVESAPDGSRIVSAVLPTNDGAFGEFHLLAQRPNGDTLYSRRYSYRPAPIPQNVADSVLASYEASARRLSPELAAAFRREARIPAYYPPLRRIAIGHDGSVWIHIASENSEGELHYVIDATGNPRGSVVLPTNGRVGAAMDDHIWTVETGEFGVQSVVRYRVSWEE